MCQSLKSLGVFQRPGVGDVWLYFSNNDRLKIPT